MNKVLIVTLCVMGIWLRWSHWAAVGITNDDAYELERIANDYRASRVFSNKENYGDHTSYPGEMLVYSTLRWLKGVRVTGGGKEKKINGMPDGWKWKLALPKVIISVIGLMVMAGLMWRMQFGWVGMMLYSFNAQMVYYGLAIRPYSVLPVLAILNFWLAARRKGTAGWIVYSAIFFLTFIYHAYGILIAGLPFIYSLIKKNEVKRWFFIVIGISFLAWGYYASYNTFGWIANASQTVDTPFRFIQPNQLIDVIVTSLCGEELLKFLLIPLIGYAIIRDEKKQLLFLGFMIALPIILICLVDIKTSYWIHPRQWVWTIPLFSVWVSQTLEYICNDCGGRGFH